MSEQTKPKYTSEYELEGRIPTGKAILLGMQHVLAMFVGNLTPILVIGGACALGDAGLIVPVIQNAMLIAGLVTLVQLLRQSVTSPVSQRAVSDVRQPIKSSQAALHATVSAIVRSRSWLYPSVSATVSARQPMSWLRCPHGSAISSAAPALFRPQSAPSF